MKIIVFSKNRIRNQVNKCPFNVLLKDATKYSHNNSRFKRISFISTNHSRNRLNRSKRNRISIIHCLSWENFLPNKIISFDLFDGFVFTKAIIIEISE